MPFGKYRTSDNGGSSAVGSCYPNVSNAFRQIPHFRREKEGKSVVLACSASPMPFGKYRTSDSS